jgi:hypothetical protein
MPTPLRTPFRAVALFLSLAGPTACAHTAPPIQSWIGAGRDMKVIPSRLVVSERCVRSTSRSPIKREANCAPPPPSLPKHRRIRFQFSLSPPPLPLRRIAMGALMARHL